METKGDCTAKYESISLCQSETVVDAHKHKSHDCNHNCATVDKRGALPCKDSKYGHDDDIHYGDETCLARGGAFNAYLLHYGGHKEDCATEYTADDGVTVEAYNLLPFPLFVEVCKEH